MQYDEVIADKMNASYHLVSFLHGKNDLLELLNIENNLQHAVVVSWGLLLVSI
jgi:hypothetical protein